MRIAIGGITHEANTFCPHITDMADFAGMNAAWDAWVDPANPPCRACVEARLASPDFNVEIMVVAAK